jgi:membrane dipeptidase
VLIVDSHLDLALNALQGNRDLQSSAYTVRVLERSMRGPGRGQGTVGFPEMRRGRIALSFATVLARSGGRA